MKNGVPGLAWYNQICVSNQGKEKLQNHMIFLITTLNLNTAVKSKFSFKHYYRFDTVATANTLQQPTAHLINSLSCKQLIGLHVQELHLLTILN